jgi:metal-responsive CopG/Arc/MetJ family transcriptional regulator
MRTTIDIPHEQRAKLLELAARRGEKGFSRLIQEALERYLDEEAEREGKVAAALKVIGSWSEADADELWDDVLRLRRRWR